MSNLVLKSRNGVWFVTGTIGGKRIRKSLGTRDRKVAEELTIQYEARLWKSAAYGEDAVRLFEEAATSYMQQGGEARYLVPIIKHFKGRVVGTIKPGEIRAMAAKIYHKAGPATKNRQAIAPARAVINHAHQLGWCNPIKVELFDVPKSRKHKPVDRAWIDAFMRQADADKLYHLSAIVLFMHQTGVRVSEAVRVEGQHVDLANRMVLLERTKTDEFATAYLTSELVVRIAALGLHDGERVFGYTERASVNRRMVAVCKRAEIEPRSTHSAGRHSFGTNAMKLDGVSVKDAMDAGRWKSARLFLETYVHSHEAGKSVADKLSRESGPIGTDLAQSQKRKGYRFGKKQ